MSRLYLFLSIIRPHQWLKNLMLYFPPFLGGVLTQEGNFIKGLLPFTAFAFASSAGYIVNDLMDREADLKHPGKSCRPLASGKITVTEAVILVIILIIVSVISSFFVNPVFTAILTAYIVVSVSYSCCLKNIPVVDIFCIATGFLFRLASGGVVFSIQITEWLFLSVFLLSLFLSAGKRLSEKLMLSYDAASHRKVLAHYPAGFLDGVLFMTGSAVLVTYTMYTLAHKTLLYTVPLCCFGLLRYIVRVLAGKGGDPTESLLRDPWLLAVGAAWVFMIGLGVYGR